MTQSTDVMFAILFIIKTSKGLTRVLYVIIMASFLEIVTKLTSKKEVPKNHDKQNKVTEIWINAESQENHVCM